MSKHNYILMKKFARNFEEELQFFFPFSFLFLPTMREHNTNDINRYKRGSTSKVKSGSVARKPVKLSGKRQESIRYILVPIQPGDIRLISIWSMDHPLEYYLHCLC